MYKRVAVVTSQLVRSHRTRQRPDRRLRDACDRGGLSQFPNREFLARVLPPVTRGDDVRVLEYGCGTGPAACYLAQRGYVVHAVDLVPDAIEIARRHATDLQLDIHFEVADVCSWTDEPEQYDVVVDSYCLQSIVLDRDRSHLFAGIGRRLKAGGQYVISTAMYEPDRDYGDDYYESETGIVWTPADGPHVDGAGLRGGRWHLPHRRHLTASALGEELEANGYRIVEQSSAGGDIVCTADHSGVDDTEHTTAAALISDQDPNEG